MVSISRVREQQFCYSLLATLALADRLPWMGSARGGLKLTEPYTLGVSFALRDVSLAPPSNWKCREK